jgi:hypothetical protein
MARNLAGLVNLDKLSEAQEAVYAIAEAAALASEKVAEAMALATAMPTEDRAAPFNMRLRLSSIAKIEARARKDGVSLKLVVSRALAAYGIEMAPSDLEDGTPRRRAA